MVDKSDAKITKFIPSNFYEFKKTPHYPNSTTASIIGHVGNRYFSIAKEDFFEPYTLVIRDDRTEIGTEPAMLLVDEDSLAEIADNVAVGLHRGLDSQKIIELLSVPKNI